jgi:hypothetical protein
MPRTQEPAPARIAERPEMLLAEHAFPLESRAGGNYRDWIHSLHRDTGEALSDVGDPMRRIFRICQMENRTDRLVSRLVWIEKSVQEALSRERAEAQALASENRFIKRMLDDRDREFSALQAEFLALKRNWIWRAIRAVRCDLGRLRRLVRPSATGAQATQQGS